ncbi:MAG TPA: flagellar basal body rod protein FlgC [Planctomycetota bacterium]|nr:flagellar basal body rod protein FlgC [Planctomycetota bacterium]
MTEPLSGMFHGFDIIGSGLKAEQQRAEVVAANLANIASTGNKHHEPYRRKSVVFAEVLDQASSLHGIDGADQLAGGVRVAKVVEDRSQFPKFMEPGNPQADEDGWVWTSNVDVFKELVDMSAIERSHEANLAALRVYRGMLQATVTNIGRS